MNLEPRMLLSNVSWTGTGDGTSWSDGLNWSGGATPVSADVVTIGAGHNITIASAVGTASIHSLQSSSPITMTGGTLAVATTATLTTGNFTLTGGTVSGGTYTTSGGAELVGNGGTLSGVSFNGSIDLSQTSAATLSVTNGLVLNGSILVGNAGGTTYGYVYFGDGSATADSLTGAASVVFGTNSNSELINYSSGSGAAGTLTFGAGVNIHGGRGAIVDGYSNGTISNLGIINAGTNGDTITVNKVANSGTLEATNGGILSLGGAWSNTATLTESASTLNLGGTFTTAGIGTLTRTAGTVNLTGTDTNTSATLALTASTGSWNLAGTIVGGTITEAGGAELVGNNGTLNGVTLNGTLDLSQFSGQTVTVLNGLVLNGSLLVGNSAGTTYGYVYFGDSSATADSLTGNATVVFGGNNNSELLNYSSGSGAAGTLTFGANVTIHGGNGAIIDSYTNGTISNLGVIDADTNGDTITVNKVANSGTLEATNGGVLALGGTWSNTATLTENASTLNLGGTFTTAGLGTLTRTAGTINLTGTLTNTSATLSLTSATGNWNLSGTIVGGTVTESGGAELVGNGGTLNGLTLNGTLDLTQFNGQTVAVLNGLVLNGSLLVGNSSGTTYGYVYFGNATATADSLTGNATVVFGTNNNSQLFNYSTGSGAAGTLTFGANVTIHGGNGSISNTYSNGTISNLGIINADTSGDTITVNNVANSGTLEATNGGILTVNGAWSNTATLTENAATLNLGGTFTTAGLGTLTRTAGTVNLTGVETNTSATLALTATTGSLNLSGTIVGGTVTEAGGAKLIAASGTLNNVTFNGTIDVSQSNGETLYVTNGLVLNGSVLVGNSAGTTYGYVYFGNATATADSLTGNATVVFGTNNNSQLFNYSTGSGAAGTLTLGANVTIHGGNGSISNTYSNGTISNLGVINADTSGDTITVNNVANSGTLEATNGGILTLAGAWSNTATLTENASTLNLGGTFTTAGVNTLTRTAGTVNLTGTDTNTSATLALTATTGSWNLSGTIVGGTVTEAGGAKLIAAGGTLSGVTFNGTIDVSQSNGETLYVTNGLVLNGSLLVGNSAGTTYGYVYFGNATANADSLTGNATVVFGTNNNSQLFNYSTGSGAAGTLTFGANVTIHGGKGSISNTYSTGTISNLGVINADTSGDTITVYNVANSGTLEATNGGILTLAGAWSNTATLTENASTLDLGGTFATAGVNTLTRTAGTVNLSGTDTNTSATLALTATTGSWNLSGTIFGGTVTEAGGAKLIAASGTLNNVTFNGTIDVSQSTGETLYVTNGLVLNGSLLVGNAAGTTYGYVYFGNATPTADSLTGNATVVFGTNNNSQLFNYSTGSGAAGTLTFGANVTIHGGNGSISNNYTNGTISNLGVINADTNGYTITVYNVANSGTLEATNGAILTVNGAWSNTATLTENASTLNLGGTFTTAGGSVTRTAGTINLTGTLTNTATILSLNAATGNWNLSGTIVGGTLTETNGAKLIAAGGTLNGVTFNGTLDVSLTSGASLTLLNGLTLNGTLLLGNAAGTTYGNIYFGNGTAGAQTLSGTATVVFGSSSNNQIVNNINGSGSSGVLTIGSGINIQGGAGALYNVYSGATFNNLGSLNANTVNRTLTIGTIASSGTILANGGNLTFNSSVTINDPSALATAPSSTVNVYGSLLGATKNSDLYNLEGTLNFNGNGTSGSPQQWEAMSSDQGNVAAGFTNNFAYGTVNLTGNTYVKLVDLSQNTTGTGANVVYVNSLVVPSGTTLNLNGIKLYVRDAQVGGTVVGTLNQVPNAGALIENTPTPGKLGVAGELDQWSFYGQAGRAVTVLLDTGSGTPSGPITPTLQYGEVQLLAPNGTVLQTIDGTTSGAILSLDDVALTTTGTYKINVRASSSHTSSTGNYIVSAYDVTSHVQTLALNQTEHSTLPNPYSLDLWNFSAVTGTQVQLLLAGTSTSGILFTLTGPGGFTGFTNLTGSSTLINLTASGNYTLTAHGTGGLTGSYNFQMVQTSVTALATGGSANSSFVGSGQALLYTVAIGTVDPLSLVLTDNATADHTELYARFGAAPTREIHDYSANGPGSSQSLLVPSANTGTWYVLVYADSVAAAPSAYSLQAFSGEIVLTGATPDQGAANALTTLTIKGAGFNSGSVVSLVSGGTSYPATTTSLDLPTQLTATFNAGTVPAGTYSIKVTQADSASASLTNVFTLAATGQSTLSTHLELPNPISRHIAETLYIDYTNTGNVATPAPLIILDATNPSGLHGALFTLNPALVGTGLWTSATPAGFSQSIQILASGATPGILQPGESERIPVYYAGWLTSQWDFAHPTLNFTLRVLQTTDPTPISWTSLQSSLQPPGISTAAWNVILTGLLPQLGSTSGSYVQLLDNNAAYLGRLGENVKDVGKLWNFTVAQAESLRPLSTLAATTDDSLPTVGSLSLSFSREFNQTIPGRFNSGLLGVGWTSRWQQSVSLQTDGTVLYNDGNGVLFTYQPDSRIPGTYFSEVGDTFTLTAANGGGYLRTSHNGIVTAFNIDGTLNYEQDTNANRITAGYTNSKLTTLVATSGQTLTLAYNAAGLLSTLTDSDNRVTTYTYDSTNTYLLSVASFNGQTISYTYNTTSGSTAQNALTSITLPGGTHQYFTYNAQGLLASTYRDGNAQTTTYAYNAGQVTTTDALGNVSRQYFNENGQISKNVDALGNPTFYTYDANYNLTKIINALGESESFTYNTLGEATSTTDFQGNITTYAYAGPFNKLSSLTDAAGNSTVYSYNSAGDMLSTTYANGLQQTTTFNPLGEATSFVNANAQPVNYTYNASGQVLTESFSDGSSYTYTYDGNGNIATAVDSTGTTTFTYDPATLLLTTVTYSNGTSLTFTYNAAHQRTKMVDQTGFTLNYTYDALGRISGLTDGSSNAIVTYAYDAVGRLSQKTNGNGTYTTYQYDAKGDVQHLINHAPGGAINSRFDYTFNAIGLVSTETTLDGTWTYTYDGNGQLTHAVFASTNGAISSQNLVYTYDSRGNRISAVINGVSTAYTTNNVNQYTSVGGNAYTYDANGNLLADSANTYTYNALNELTSITTSGVTTTFTYNALGQRITSAVGGTITQNLIDPAGIGNVVGTFTSGGALITDYTYGLGLTSQITGAGTKSYYDFDALGSTVGLSNSGGSYANSYSYLPFGGTLAASTTIANTYTYVGQYGVSTIAPTQFITPARAFSSTTGRFEGVDPLLITDGETNAYTYAQNDPVLKIDPSGKKFSYSTIKGVTVKIGGKSGSKVAPKSGGAIIIVLGGTPSYGVGYGYGSSIGGYYGSDPGQDPGYAPQGPDGPSDGGDGGDGGGDGGDGGGDGGDGGGDGGDGGGDGGDGGGDGGGGGDGPFGPGGDGPSPGPGGGGDGGGGGAGTVNAQDPNALYGPAGYGASNYLASSVTSYGYQIDFENAATATAPAQQVMVTDQLSSNLKWNTFQLSTISWGNTLITIPAGTQHYQTTVSMTYNGSTFNVLVEAGINPSTGLVYATFQSIDPSTGLPPVNPLTGFLPPENGTGRGVGYVGFTIAPKTSLATGTQIRNIANITFDQGTTLATNLVNDENPSLGTDPTKEALITIDVGAPTSHVNALPATSSTLFSVSWSGADDANGSGIGSYNVYVSDNGSAFTLWQSAATTTSASYPGVLGHTYGFYTVATDNVGHVESKAAAAQTSTLVSTIQPTTVSTTTTVSSSALTAATGSTVTFTATITGQSPTGTVTFFDGSISLGTGTLNGSGQATFTTSSLALGSHSISASYPGDTANLASASTAISQIINSATIPEYRLYLAQTAEHLYTTDLNEYNILATRGWSQEGVAYYMYSGTAIVSGVTSEAYYRLYNPSILQHLWTTDANEYAILATKGWTQEGIIGYVFASQVTGGESLYRLNEPDAKVHLWTTDVNEYTILATKGWVQESIIGYVLSQGT